MTNGIDEFFGDGCKSSWQCGTRGVEMKESLPLKARGCRAELLRMSYKFQILEKCSNNSRRAASKMSLRPETPSNVSSSSGVRAF